MSYGRALTATACRHLRTKCRVHRSKISCQMERTWALRRPPRSVPPAWPSALVKASGLSSSEPRDFGTFYHSWFFHFHHSALHIVVSEVASKPNAARERRDASARARGARSPAKRGKRSAAQKTIAKPEFSFVTRHSAAARNSR